MNNKDFLIRIITVFLFTVLLTGIFYFEALNLVQKSADSLSKIKFDDVNVKINGLNTTLLI